MTLDDGRIEEIWEQAEQAAKSVSDWLVQVAGLDLDDVVADGGITAGMVVKQEALGLANKLDRAAHRARSGAYGGGA